MTEPVDDVTYWDEDEDPEALMGEDDECRLGGEDA